MDGRGGGGRRFAVLLCADDSDYVKKMYGGYFGVFLRMLAEEGDVWHLYRVASGEFPNEDEIADYNGFVITGSSSDAHGNEAWICKLISLLKRLDSMKKKILGICFGHQVLGRALGGKTERAKSGWSIGVTRVHLSPSSKILKSLKFPAALSVIKCHQDEVWELPPKAEIMAWSNKTGIEMFRWDDHIMGIQGHPEYTKDILLNIIDRLAQRGFIEDSYADEVKVDVNTEREPDWEPWKKLCIGFLKGKL